MFLSINVFLISLYLRQYCLLIIECKYMDKHKTTHMAIHMCGPMFISIVLSYVCVYLYICVCVFVCVCAQRCMHMLHYLLFIGYSHTTADSVNKKCTNFCTYNFDKEESFQHSTLNASLNASVYFHGSYYYYIWVLKLRILLCFCHLSLNHHISNCLEKMSEPSLSSALRQSSLYISQL